MSLRNLFKDETIRREVITQGQVVPDSSRCVQCGVCSFHCPVGIDIRRHAWLGVPIKASHCLTCGECITRCPRGVLRFVRSKLFSDQ